MVEKYRGPEFDIQPEGSVPSKITAPDISDRVILAKNLHRVRKEVSEEFSLAESAEEQEDFLEKKTLVCAGLSHLLDRFDRADVHKQLAKESASFKLQKGRQARIGVIEKPRLLACYEDLDNLLHIFSPIRFSKNKQILEFMDRVIESLPLLTQEVDELLTRGRTLTDPTMISGIIDHPSTGLAAPSLATEGMSKVETTLDMGQVKFEENMPTIEFPVPGAEVTAPISSVHQVKSSPKNSWKSSSVRALALAASFLMTPADTRPVTRYEPAPRQTHAAQKDPQRLRLPDEQDKQAVEVTPAYEKFRELGADMEANSLRLKAPRLERSLYWVFLEAGKDQNITHRTWKNIAEVEEQSRWAAKWAAQLLENGRVNKKFIKYSTINVDLVRDISSYEKDVLTIQDTAAFYERLVKPLLDFKRD